MMAEEDSGQSPFSRPGFVVSAVVIAVIVAVGITLGVVNLAGDRSDSGAESVSVSPSVTGPSQGDTTGSDGGFSASASASSSAGGLVSVCGLPAAVGGPQRLTKAPAVDEWVYTGVMAYPTSATYGPGKADVSYRWCFQQSPEGALFAAANAAAQGTNQKTVREWLEYFVAEGPNREQLLNQDASNSSSDGMRIEINGFRLLAYDGQTANVEIGVEGIVEGRTVYLSMIYSLVWEKGDWKLKVENPDTPINVAEVPNLNGYITWRP